MHGSHGFLVTHDNSFKFIKNQSSRDFLTEYWYCKQRIGDIKCRATASTYSLDGKNYFLKTCSPPEDHIHAPDKLNIFKDRLLADIKKVSKNHPSTFTGKSSLGLLKL